jgi:hypothetical protein
MSRSGYHGQVGCIFSPGFLDAIELGAVRMEGMAEGEAVGGEETDVGREDDEGEKTEEGRPQARFSRA